MPQPQPAVVSIPAAVPAVAAVVAAGRESIPLGQNVPNVPLVGRESAPLHLQGGRESVQSVQSLQAAHHVPVIQTLRDPQVHLQQQQSSQRTPPVVQSGVYPPSVLPHNYIPGASYPSASLAQSLVAIPPHQPQYPPAVAHQAAPGYISVGGHGQPQPGHLIGPYPPHHPTNHGPFTTFQPQLQQLPVASLHHGGQYPHGEVSTVSRPPIMSTVSQPSQYQQYPAGHLVQAGHVPVMVQYQYQPVPGPPGPAQVLPQSLTSSYHEATGGQAVTSGDDPQDS